MINAGVVVFSGVDNPVTLLRYAPTSENPIVDFITTAWSAEGDWDAARNLWDTISEELKIHEVVGDVGTGAGLCVRDFYPDVKKTKTLWGVDRIMPYYNLGGG